MNRPQLEALHKIERDLAFNVENSPVVIEDRALLHMILQAVDPVPHMTREDLIIKFEQGDLEDEAVFDLFQEMIDDGSVWNSKPFLVHMAENLISAGFCVRRRIEIRNYPPE